MMILYPGDRVHVNFPTSLDRRHDVSQVQALKAFYATMGVEVAHMTFTDTARQPAIVAVFRKGET